MASGHWQATGTSVSAGAVAGVTISASAGAINGGQVIRVRAVQASLAGGSAGAGHLVVRDGAAGSGTIIWSAEASVVVNGGMVINAEPIDLRASVGNNLVIEFTSATTGDLQSVNAQGDLCPVGTPYAGAP